MSNDLFITSYQNITQKISDIKNRHWAFLLALGGSHSFYFSQSTNQIWILVGHLIFCLFALFFLTDGNKALSKNRDILEDYNAIFRKDRRLKNLVTKKPTEKDRGDKLMLLSAWLVPILSGIYVSTHYFMSH